MITAAKARQLSGFTVQEKVARILVHVEEMAKAGKRELRCGWDYKEDSDLWIRGGYSRTKDWNEATKILEGLGFKVEFYYMETQFVDMYTHIMW